MVFRFGPSHLLGKIIDLQVLKLNNWMTGLDALSKWVEATQQAKIVPSDS